MKEKATSLGLVLCVTVPLDLLDVRAPYVAIAILVLFSIWIASRIHAPRGSRHKT